MQGYADLHAWGSAVSALWGAMRHKETPLTHIAGAYVEGEPLLSGVDGSEQAGNRKSSGSTLSIYQLTPWIWRSRGVSHSSRKTGAVYPSPRARAQNHNVKLRAPSVDCLGSGAAQVHTTLYSG